MTKKRNRSLSLTLQFESSEAQHHFWVWLCESGEQSYWDWMRERECDEDEGDITGLNFEYKDADGGMVVVKCGRLDGDR